MRVNAGDQETGENQQTPAEVDGAAARLARRVDAGAAGRIAGRIDTSLVIVDEPPLGEELGAGDDEDEGEEDERLAAA